MRIYVTSNISIRVVYQQ